MDEAAPPQPPPPPPQESELLQQQQDSSQLQFTVLYGTHSSSSAAVCYLLEISGVKILLDCGWDSNYDPNLLEPLERIADKIQLILISHADLEHMGALAYAYKNFKLKAQCWCTKPVVKFGHLNMYDAVLNGAAPFTLDDVDQCMLRCKECAFQQELKIRHGGEGQGEILITPRASGRSLGGAIWSVMNEESALNVQYATDTNLLREALLEGMDLSSLTKNPTLLILDCLGAAAPKQKQQQVQQYAETKEKRALRALEDTLKRGGDVLIPVPCTSRVVEVLLLLNEEWTRNPALRQFDLVFLTRVSSILGIAENHVEWVSRRLQELDHTSMLSPLKFGQVQVVDSFEDAFPSTLAARRNRAPRVVVCGGADIERSSFSREALVREMAHRPNSLILLLFSSHVKSSVTSQLMRGERVVDMDEERWVDLVGEELAEWQRKRDAKAAERAREEENEQEFEQFEILDEADAAIAEAVAPTAKQAAVLERGLFKDGHDKEEIFSFVPQFEEEHNAGWDEYGAIFDARGLSKSEEEKSTSLTPSLPVATPTGWQPAANAEQQDMGPRRKEKIITKQQVLCHVTFVDFDGRNGRGDLLEIVDQIKPKKLAVVRCGLREAESFGSDCQSKASCGVALNPPPGETLDVAADSSVVRVRIPDETLQTSPSAVTFGNFTIQRIRGKMSFLSTLAKQQQQQLQQLPEKRRRLLVGGAEIPSIVSRRQEEEQEQEQAAATAATTGAAVIAESAECAWVSKIKEPDLTFIFKKLKQKNIPVALVSSVLLCGNSQEVQVWKPADGRLLVSGPLCELYFETRKIVYSCFALV